MNILKYFPLVITVIRSLELLLQDPNESEIKTVVSNLSVDVLQLVESITGKDILNDESVRKATSEIVEAVISIVHVIQTRPDKEND